MLKLLPRKAEGYNGASAWIMQSCRRFLQDIKIEEKLPIFSQGVHTSNLQ